VLLLSLGGVSCSGGGGPKLNPVQGKVLYKKEPLPGALFTFHPKDTTDMNVIPPVGLTGEDGTFKVTTGQKDGAAAGEYVVTIICSQVPTGGKKPVSTGGVDTQDRLGGTYADRANSRITVKIKEGTNQLEPFDLK
jgi:hypothetical protein